MDAEPLAYTPHPEARTRVRLEPSVTVATAAKRAPGGTVAALTGAAVVGVSLAFGAAGVSMQIAEREAAPVAEKARPFAVRESAAPAKPWTEPVAGSAELRSASPLPVVGDALAPTAEEYAAAQAKIQAEEAAAAQPQRPMAYHSLTSFSGNRTIEIGTAGQAEPEAPRAGWAPPPPVAWNAPVQWIKVHESSLDR
jgi:hypothetical protein